MPEPTVHRSKVWEVGPRRPSARVVGLNLALLVQNDATTAIPLEVFDESAADPDATIFSTNRAIASTLFDTLQTWDLDAVGFNFQDTIGTNEVVLEGGHKYRLEYQISTSSGNVPVVFEWRVTGLRGS